MTASSIRGKDALEIHRVVAKALGFRKVAERMPMARASRMTRGYDAFIAHASEDKAEVASPLAAMLKVRGYRLWMDALKLRVGDSLRREIDKGLANSRFGIVIMSPAFFGKEWPQRELDALFSKELVQERGVILPVWHGVTLVSGRIATKTADGLSRVVKDLTNAMGRARGNEKPKRARGAAARATPPTHGAAEGAPLPASKRLTRS